MIRQPVLRQALMVAQEDWLVVVYLLQLDEWAQLREVQPVQVAEPKPLGRD